MYKKIVFIILFIFIVVFSSPVLAQKENENNFSEETFEAQVVKVLEKRTVRKEDGFTATLQKLKLLGTSGSWKNKEIFFDGTEIDVIAKNIYKTGDKVLVSRSLSSDGSEKFYVTDYVRRGNLYLLSVLFFIVVLLTGRWRGFRAILGLGLSFFIIFYFIIPQILKGNNPLAVSLFFSILIIVASTYLVYGLNKKSNIAIVGTFAGIAIVGTLSLVFTKLTHLAGFAYDESLYLVSLMGGDINLQGLLLAGFIIGALGVLDDITVSQVSTVKELTEANSALKLRETYKRAMKVGVDHIASMVNTLFLAYAGASFSLLLLFSFKQSPFLTFSQVINNEIIATEIVRTLVGSIGLTLAVPITTLLASYFYTKRKK